MGSHEVGVVFFFRGKACKIGVSASTFFVLPSKGFWAGTSRFRLLEGPLCEKLITVKESFFYGDTQAQMSFFIVENKCLISFLLKKLIGK